MKTRLPADEIAQQQQLLRTYRHTLAVYLRQEAERGGTAYAPIELINGIDESRRNIARVKRILRDAGVTVEDYPDDASADDWAPSTPERADVSASPTRRPWHWGVFVGTGVVGVLLIVLLARLLLSPSLGLPWRITPTEQVFTVMGQSMEPTLHTGQVVTIEPVDPTALHRGDVVLITPFNTAPFLKRIIGLPGDTISIHDGQVYVNNIVQNEPYVHGVPTICRPDEVCSPRQVINGAVFVLGDNRNNSSDSREFGPLPISQIKGRIRIADTNQQTP